MAATLLSKEEVGIGGTRDSGRTSSRTPGGRTPDGTAGDGTLNRTTRRAINRANHLIRTGKIAEGTRILESLASRTPTGHESDRISETRGATRTDVDGETTDVQSVTSRQETLAFAILRQFLLEENPYDMTPENWMTLCDQARLGAVVFTNRMRTEEPELTRPRSGDTTPTRGRGRGDRRTDSL